MRSLYGLIWRTLTAYRGRTVLCILATALGVASSIAVNGVAQSLRKGIFKSDEARLLMSGMIDQLNPFLNFVGLIIMLVAGFLIFNAFAMAVTQRRQQIGALRMIGLTGRQVWRLLVIEALAVGTVGTFIGVVVSLPLGNGMVALMRAVIGGYIPLEEAPASADAVILSLLMGVGVTIFAMLFPARRAAQVSPLEAAQDGDAAGMETHPTWRAWLGLALMVVLISYLIAAPPGEWVIYPVDLILSALLVALWTLAVVLMLPRLIDLLGSRLRPLLARRFHASGRLLADNLRRARGRAMLTVLTMMIALWVLTGLTGFMDFMFGKLLIQTLQTSAAQQVMMVSRIDVAAGWTQALARQLDSLLLSSEEVTAVEIVVAGRGTASAVYMVVVPELSFMGSGYFSYVMNPDTLPGMGDTLFTFQEGSWETALPIMRSGCGVLVMPQVAATNGARLGDTITVTGARGPVSCTIAGIGRSAAMSSIIGQAAAADFGVTRPFLLFFRPASEAEAIKVKADLHARLPDLAVISMKVFITAMDEVIRLLTVTLNGMLLLAILTAALGVINTTVMSVAERRREIGLLRAVGATRSQVRMVILGEAAMMGLIGAAAGLVAGVGFTVIFAVTYGGNSWGVPDLALWPAALESAQPGLAVGLVGLVAAPLVSAVAAWFPARGILRETPVETLALQ